MGDLYCANGRHLIEGESMLYNFERELFYCGSTCARQAEVREMFRQPWVLRKPFRQIDRDEALKLLKDGGIEARVVKE